MGRQKKKVGPAKRAPKGRRGSTVIFGYSDTSSEVIRRESAPYPVSGKEIQTPLLEKFVPTFSVGCFRVQFNPQTMTFEVALSQNKGKGTSNPLWGAPGGKNKTPQETHFDALKNHMQRETGFVVLSEEVQLLSMSSKKNEKSETTPFEKRFYVNIVEYSAKLPFCSKDSVLKSEFVPIPRVFNELYKEMIHEHFLAIKPLDFFIQTKYEDISEAKKVIETFSHFYLKEKLLNNVVA